MFDRKNGISGENAEHMEFVRNVAKPVFESWGYQVILLRSDLDYLDCFYRIIKNPQKHPENMGKYFGFPITGMCGVIRDCKIRRINTFLRAQKEPVIQYIGIAADEKRRIPALLKDPSKCSLLLKYGYSEEDAREKCEEYGLLNPSYHVSKRGGCWFCPYAKLSEHQYLYQTDPETWSRFVLLEKEDNVAFNRWNHFSTTLAHRDVLVRS